ncbi:MAG TPA: hypothetical protein VG273_14875 [Bryobacteraceae bacterium]|nr:hypothetical protein [Bryobacteraceae bacterium]
MSDGPGVITWHLREWRAGEPEALSLLTSAIYAERRRWRLSSTPAPGTTRFSPPELVHELYLELPGFRQLDIESRAHLFNLAARVMRT